MIRGARRQWTLRLRWMQVQYRIVQHSAAHYRTAHYAIIYNRLQYSTLLVLIIQPHPAHFLFPHLKPPFLLFLYSSSCPSIPSLFPPYSPVARLNLRYAVRVGAV
jgi:hypothetical protein